MTITREVRLALSDGSSLPAALVIPGDIVAPVAAVIVIHEAIGLNDDIRRLAGRFADAGYVALAPDFLAGLGPMPFCIARFARGIGRVGTGRPYRQLAAAQAWLGELPDVDADRIGLAGFCMGGGFALLYAAGADVDVVAPFYAAVPKDDDALRGICPVVASYGGRDGVFADGGPRLAGMLGRLGVEHDIETYPSAGHSFMSHHAGPLARIEAHLPTHGGHDPVAAEDAWRRTLAFFGRHLRAAGPAIHG